MNMKKTAGVLLFSLMLCMTVVLLWVYKKYDNRYEVKISYDSGIYDKSFDLIVETGSEAIIFYTTDGSIPDIENGDPEIYTGPIHIEMKDETAVYSYRICCLFEDGTKSEVYNRDYFVDPKGRGRFTTTYTVAITGKEEDTFGYEEGIFARGIRWDRYWEENPDSSIWAKIDGNFWLDKEIEVHATILDKEGTELISQNCGLKIYGNYTRAKNQKSFRLFARDEYEGKNEFSYPFISTLISDETNTVIDDYQRLSFHNTGDDNGYGFIRTELVGELARQSGYPDVLLADSAVVFVNGKYQGVYWLVNTYDDRYFQEKYGDYSGEFYVCQGALNEVHEENAKTSEELEIYREYNAFVDWVVSADLEKAQNWEYIEKKLDLQDFALYMAIQYYIGNIDWPQNNVKVYAYRPSEGEAYREGTVFDGRYRYPLFDTDYGMGLRFWGTVFYGLDHAYKRLEALCEKEGDAALFAALIEKEEFRDLFVHSVMHIMNTGFQKDNVHTVLYDMNSLRYAELEHMMQNTDLLKGSLTESDDNNIQNVLNEMNRIVEYGYYRPEVVIEELQTHFDLQDVCSVQVNADFDGEISLNGYTVENGAIGNYFSDIPLRIQCTPEPGVTIIGYEVNGKRVEGEVLEITPNEFGAEHLEITILAVVDAMAESLIVSQYHVKGTQDYVVLENNGQATLNLENYCLTDDEKELTKGKLPKTFLKPGEVYYVYGKEYTGRKEKNSVQLSFSWSTDEEIFLIKK